MREINDYTTSVDALDFQPPPGVWSNKIIFKPVDAAVHFDIAGEGVSGGGDPLHVHTINKKLTALIYVDRHMPGSHALIEIVYSKGASDPGESEQFSLQPGGSKQLLDGSLLVHEK